MTKTNLPRWDIFCSVIDNYGDIGVCWRLARQLVNEHGFDVTLWVDDLNAFRRLCPEVDPARAGQRVAGVDVRFWTANGVPLWGKDDDGQRKNQVADVVIEAFACELPEDYVQAMAARPGLACWYNLEYLSAESWIDSCHLLDSPHPRYPLVKRFFFPGFSTASGGLLRERLLDAERRHWQNSPVRQEVFWQQLGLPPRQPHEQRISVFCYPTPALASLFDIWSRHQYPVTVILPADRARESVAALFDAPLTEDTLHRIGSLTVKVIPFVTQDDYDRLLWSCDFNIVRGEDSFLRAQWAARPMLWHIYPQADDAHMKKLDAFLQRYSQLLPEHCLSPLYQMCECFNQGDTIEPMLWHWHDQAAPLLLRHAENWTTQLLVQRDLMNQLVQDAQNWLQ